MRGECAKVELSLNTRGGKKARMRRTISTLLLALICATVLECTSYAQIPVPDPKPIIGGRMPALSPDGKKLAFVYRGDIWIADSSGGRATPLTRNVAMDAYPQFSPDGNWISFSSLRTGNWDIFLIPAVGGDVKQMTYYSGSEISFGWSPDGKSLIFNGARDTTDSCLYTIDVNTRRIKKLTQDYFDMSHSSFSPDGKYVVYGRNGFSWTRPRYNGSGAMRMWVFNTEDGTRRCIVDDDKQHLWSRFLPDNKTLMTVTVGEVTPSSHKLGERTPKNVDSAERTPNIWFFGLNGKGKRITSFVGGSVRCPNVAIKSGDIVFEHEHDLYMLKAGAQEPQKIALFASEDDAQNPLRHETLKSGATEMEVSPDDKTFVFGIKNDIWTVPVERPKGAAGKGLEIA